MVRLLVACCALISLLGGCATYATFRHPSGVAVQPLGPSDIVYVADYQSVRRIIGPVVTTLAGPTHASSGGQCPTGYVDGTGTAARFNYITAIVRDPTTGNLYVTEHSNNAVRKITPAGVVSTVAGQGPAAGPVTTPSVDGPPAVATFNHPTGIAIDPAGTFLYVADSYDYSIRRIDLATQQVDTVVGGRYLFPSVPGSLHLSNPAAVWFQPGSPNLLYVADQGWGRIRTLDLSLYAGTPLSPAVLAVMPPGSAFSLNYPVGLAIDAAGNIYVTEGNGGAMANQVRRGPVGGGTYPIAAGGTPAGDSGAVPIGLNARFNTPAGIALSPLGVLYIADSRNNRIKRMNLMPPHAVGVVAGHEPGNPQGCRDGGV